MVKKLSKEMTEEIREENLLDYLIRVAKPVTREDLKKAGLEAGRKELRELEKNGLITKVENYTNNTVKKDIGDKVLQGTRYYTYEIVK